MPQGCIARLWYRVVRSYDVYVHVVFVVVDSLYTVKLSIQFYIDLYIPLFTLEVFVLLFKEKRTFFRLIFPFSCINS